ncbi:uncharacterized protein LOC143358836 [Halictus rubicundus]|uniref:uncharacterized protein LOC143358836 n=1 Tax=Halictus rubicundus TaxID=77578 RepID=UPI0040352A09
MYPKTSEIPENERKLIVKWRNEGKTYGEISKLLNINRSAIHYILKRSKYEGTVKNKYSSGRPKKLTEKEERALIGEIKRNKKISATELATIGKDYFKKDVNPYERSRKGFKKFNIASKASLKEKILEVWNSISPNVTENTAIHSGWWKTHAEKMDQEKLIEHVKLCEPLYATSHPKYGDSVFKENAWREIAKEMNQPVTICKKVWTSLRDSFRRISKKKRETKSGQATTKIRKWKFEDEMSFLQPYMQERDTYTNLKYVSDDEEQSNNQNSEKNDEVGDGDDIHSDKDGDDDADHNGDARKKQEKEINRKIIRNRKSRQALQETASSVMVKYLLNKRPAHTQATSAPKPNSIDLFCSSIATTMKNFSPYYQNIAKSQIFNLISDLEMKQIMQQEPFCVPNAPPQHGQSVPMSRTVSFEAQKSCYTEPCNMPHPSVSSFRSPSTMPISTPSPSPSVIPIPTPHDSLRTRFYWPKVKM